MERKTEGTQRNSKGDRQKSRKIKLRRKMTKGPLQKTEKANRDERGRKKKTTKNKTKQKQNEK